MDRLHHAKSNRSKIIDRIHITDRDIKSLLDSGANISVFGQHGMNLIRKWNLKMENVNMQLKTADGTKHSCYGQITLPITFLDKTKIITLFGAPELKETLILGTNFWQTFKICPTMYDD